MPSPRPSTLLADTGRALFGELSYALAERLTYIDWRLGMRGSIRRSDIMQQFRVSETQASFDLREYMERWPAAIRYDKSAKCYVPAHDPHRAALGTADPVFRRAISLLAGIGHPMGWS